MHAHEAVAHEFAEHLERAFGLSRISFTTPPMAILPSLPWASAAVGPLWSLGSPSARRVASWYYWVDTGIGMRFPAVRLTERRTLTIGTRTKCTFA